MKKLILAALLILAGSWGASAQRTTTTKFRYTQARILDLTSNAYVKPLTVELEVIGPKDSLVLDLSKEAAEIELNGDIPNIKSWGTFVASQTWDCDLIVAPTYQLRTISSGDYRLTVVGFPARYKNWATATEDDYEWIRMETRQVSGDKTAPVVRTKF